MDSFKYLAKRILQEFEEIVVISDADLNGVIFELFGRKYAIFEKGKGCFPVVAAIDHDDSYPHLMFTEYTIGTEHWRAICLFEAGSVIEYIYTEEERIKTCIERLIELVSLSPSQIIEEYHKEFLVYWLKYGITKGKHDNIQYQLYLDCSNEFQWLEQHLYKNNCVRITKPERQFNDSDKRLQIKEIPALYLPIEDARELLPPLKNKPWNAHTINDIIGGVVFQRISNQAFESISQQSYSQKEILLVFKLENMYFGCVVEFKNPGTAKLVVKLESQISKVVPIIVSRCDFEFLNEQIGNTVHNERVVVVGAGSLGSYIVDELAHAGYKNITVVDDDEYEHANVFRHRAKWFAVQLFKSRLIEFDVNNIHPEMNVKSVAKRLLVDNIDECIPRDTQIIIFTVGSSDSQLQLNSTFIRSALKADIYYAWLEHDAESSHVVVIKDPKEGCFECLFTDKDGNMCNNIINQADPATLVYTRNGCGGTRIHYGNRTLLTASALVLTALKDNSRGNAIFSYVNGAMCKRDFPQNKRCACCGICE